MKGMPGISSGGHVALRYISLGLAAATSVLANGAASVCTPGEVRAMTDPPWVMAPSIEPFQPTGSFELTFMPRGTLHPAGENIVFQLSGDGIFRSADDSAIWRFLDPASSQENALAVSPQFSQDRAVVAGLGNIFLSAPSDSVRLSSDGGLTWRSPQQPVDGHVVALGMSSAFREDQAVYAAVYDTYSARLLRSLDGGEHWSDVTHPARGHTYSYIREIVLSPYFATDQTLFALVSVDNALWRSTDGGMSWSRADGPLGASMGNTLHDVAAVPLSGRTTGLIVATQYALVITFDGGEIWYLVSAQAFTHIAVPSDFGSSLTLFGVDPDGVLRRSEDLGTSWQNVLGGIGEVAVSPAYPQDGTVYARGSTAFFVSHDRGGHWTQKGGRPDVNLEYNDAFELVTSPSFDADGIIFALPQHSDGADWLLKSVDGGMTWRQISLPESSRRTELALSPAFASDATAYLLIGNSLYKSADGGESWALIQAPQPTGSHLVRVSPDYAVDGAIFVGVYDPQGSGGVYRSTGDGHAWTLLTGSVARAVTDYDISPDYPNDPTMFVVDYNDGIFRSDNGGGSWTHLIDPTFSPDFRVVLSPRFAADGTLFAAATGSSSGGVFRSDDRGNTWVDVTAGVLTWYLSTIRVSPDFEHDQTIIVGKSEGEFYMSEDKGSTWFTLQGVKPGDAGSHGREAAGTVAYEDGRLVIFASTPRIGVYKYRWPSLSLPAGLAIGIPWGTTGPYTRSVTLARNTREEIRLALTETADWLTISPVTGTVPLTLAMTADLTAHPDTVRTQVLADVHYSLRQKDAASIEVVAFYVRGEAWLPIAGRSAWIQSMSAGTGRGELTGSQVKREVSRREGGDWSFASWACRERLVLSEHCANLEEIQEGDLTAMTAGTPNQAVCGPIEQCLAYVPEPATLAVVDAVLREQAYQCSCPNVDRLSLCVADRVSIRDARAVEQCIAECSHCAEELMELLPLEVRDSLFWEED